MKKIVTAILAVLYLSTSSGATIHLHYCMGKLINWGLWHTESKKCDKCGMDKLLKASQKDGCCKDEHKRIQTEKDQKLTETVSNLVKATSGTFLSSQVEFPSPNISTITETNPVSNAPPPTQVPIYIRNCVFLI